MSWSIVLVLVALASRALLSRRGWLLVALSALGLQAALSVTLRPDINACRAVHTPERPVTGSAVAWGPHRSVPLDTRRLSIEGAADFQAPRRVVLTSAGALDEPALGIVQAELVAKPTATEMTLVVSGQKRPSAEDRVTRAVTIPVERGREQVLVEIRLKELLGGNWDSADAIRSVELTGGELVELTLHGDGWEFQGHGGTATVETDGIFRPSIWLRPGVTITLELPTAEGEVRFHPGGTAKPVLHREGTTLTLTATGTGVALLGDPRLVFPTEEPAPVVLLYMVDTLREDRSHTPTLEMLRADGLDFPQTWSTSAWTKPAIPSLMSGFEPSTHRVGATGVGDTLPESVHTVQDRFRDAGWRTGSFSGSPLGSSLSGLEQGFGTAYAPRHWGLDRGRHHPSAEQLHTALVDWLDQDPSEPAFAYVHAMDVHEYETRRPLVSTVGDYEDAVAAWDADLARLLDSIDRPLVIAVISDHGESFWDHRASRHGTGLWASQTHVPWVIHGAGMQGTVSKPVSLADVAPTLLELVGLPTLGADGKNALRRVGPVFSSLIHYTWKPDQPSSVAIARDGWRRIEREDGLRVGFEVATDRCEATPVATDALEAPLREWQLNSIEKAERFTSQHGPVGAGAVQTDDLMRLRALGYIE